MPHPGRVINSHRVGVSSLVVGFRSARSRTLVIWYVAVVVAATLAGVFRSAVSDHASTVNIDFEVYRAGGRAVLDGAALYEGAFPAMNMMLPFTYPPLAALAFVPLAQLSSSVGYIAFTTVSVIAIALTVSVVLYSLAGQYGRRITGPQALACGVLALPAAVWLWPLTNTLQFGQINILLMLLVVADLLLPRTPWPRGMLVGLAAAVKLTPAVFGLYFLLRRQWREAATSVVSGIVFSALAWVVLPSDSRTYWTDTLSDPGRIGDLAYGANQSLRGLVARFTGDPAQTWIWYVLVVAVVVAIVLVMLHQLAAGAFAGAVCTNALLGLLASPVSWSHHWVWVLPMLLVAGAAAFPSRRSDARTGRVALVVAVPLAVISLVLPVHVFLESGGGVESGWTLWMKVLGSEFVLVGLLWLVVAGAAHRSNGPASVGPARYPEDTPPQRR